MRQESIEGIILRHSKRGMTILQRELPEDYCRIAAREILSWKRGTVLLTTGYIESGGEKDGSSLPGERFSPGREEPSFSPPDSM